MLGSGQFLSDIQYELPLDTRCCARSTCQCSVQDMLEEKPTKWSGLAPIAGKLFAAFYSFLVLGAIDASYGVSATTSSTANTTDSAGSTPISDRLL